MSAPSLWQLAKSSVVLWVGLVFVPVGAVLVCVAINLALEELAFAKRGQTIDATIVDKSLQKADFDHNPSTRYLIHYRFATAAGVQLDETKVVSLEEWERLAPGSITQIRVLPGARLETRVTQKSDWSAVVALLVLGLIFLAAGAPLIWLAVREIQRQRKLWRTGTTVPAVVTSVAPSSTWINRVQQWEIRYAYTDASGSKHTGRSNSMPRNEATHWRSGDRGHARVDPNAADSSIWLGNATPKD